MTTYQGGNSSVGFTKYISEGFQSWGHVLICWESEQASGPALGWTLCRDTGMFTPADLIERYMGRLGERRLSIPYHGGPILRSDIRIVKDQSYNRAKEQGTWVCILIEDRTCPCIQRYYAHNATQCNAYFRVHIRRPKKTILEIA